MKRNRSRLANELGARLILGMFFITSLMVVLISVFVRVQMTRSGEMLTEATQDHLKSAAQALAKFVTAEELDLYHTPEDSQTEAFQDLKHRLVAFAESHNLLYAYFWRTYGNAQLQFIVDNDFDPEEEVGPWTIIPITDDYLAIYAIEGNIVASNLSAIVPTWDGLITAYAPVFDSEGNFYCVAGVDISHNYLYLQRRDSQRMTLLQSIAIPLAVISGILNMILYRRRAKQIQTTNVKLAYERDMIQTMKDNINQGIFLMDKDLNILPQYSSTLIDILSYYGSDLTGRNFLDIIRISFAATEIQDISDYFSMVLEKEKNAKVLEAANPIYEFEYKVDDEIKHLSTSFQLIEQENAEPVIIGIVEDITREKEFERELQIQKETQEIEMKNMFDVLKIDPVIFRDFIEDIEANFNYINSLLKDRSLSEKQVVTKIFQNVHAIKANALILGLENLGEELHNLEDVIKTISAKETIAQEDILILAIRIETLMQKVDSYSTITKKINSYKTAHGVDAIFINSISKAAERLAEENGKMVEVKAGQVDVNILESKLRKPIKDILYQCVRNSIYHGIELTDEREKKGKSPKGLLVFSIKNIDGNAEVIFSDDGTGLAWEKIRKKYLEKHPGTKNIDKKVLLGSIFTPEFSTANESSDTIHAGRGVGLSLVKDLVKENNGTIKVNSTESGLTFRFTFPFN